MSIKNLLSENTKSDQNVSINNLSVNSENSIYSTPITNVEEFTSDITWVCGNGTPVTVTNGVSLFRINNHILVKFEPFTLTSGAVPVPNISSTTIPERFNSTCPLSSVTSDFLIVGGSTTSTNIIYSSSGMNFEIFNQDLSNFPTTTTISKLYCTNGNYTTT